MAHLVSYFLCLYPSEIVCFNGIDMTRQYYSQRKGLTKHQGFGLPTLIELFKRVYDNIATDELLIENFGGWKCIDNDEPEIGRLGRNPDIALMLTTKKSNLYPVIARADQYSEDDLFDVIEFLYDHVSKPVVTENTYFHSYGNCGYHYETYDTKLGQQEYAEKINPLLDGYLDGFELNNAGEVVVKPQPEVARLIRHGLPETTPTNIVEKVNAAKSKFLNSRTGLDGRRDAVRDLADVFEYLKKSGRLKLNQKDDSLLFEIANNFAIRHFNGKQKTDYDENVWLSWMFHFYLATLHACLRLISKK
ncbi:MAG TPA: hypothetical protein VFT53_03030 [Candidatus Saccharimonadales bacterium]|nr:hypothetical protein [Candidatus Saccharimonadales bacterium]